MAERHQGCPVHGPKKIIATASRKLAQAKRPYLAAATAISEKTGKNCSQDTPKNDSEKMKQKKQKKNISYADSASRAKKNEKTLGRRKRSTPTGLMPGGTTTAPVKKIYNMTIHMHSKVTRFCKPVAASSATAVFPKSVCVYCASHQATILRIPLSR